jgi:hypothetical protein
MPTWKVTVKRMKEVPVDPKKPDGKTHLVHDATAAREETNVSGDYAEPDDVKKFATTHWKHLEFVKAEPVPSPQAGRAAQLVAELTTLLETDLHAPEHADLIKSLKSLTTGK